MISDPRQQTGDKEHPPRRPCTDNPADQPKPVPDEPNCDELDVPKAPSPPVPTVECKPPECCPRPSESDSSCLSDLIDEQQKDIAKAERAKAFKTELEALLQKVKAAKAEYTVDKYNKLLERWKKQDKEIVELIDKLTCTLPYWRTLIECFVCPLLYEIRLIERRLEGDKLTYDTVHSLRDLRYWHERNRDAWQAVFDRIKKVMSAWEKPAQTIDKVLADNAKLIDDIRKALGAVDAGKLAYDLFVRLIPMHLAIAPPPGSDTTTAIDKQYTDLCKCDEGEPDACCGPDTGRTTVLASLLGPQPYLVHPDRYDAVVCCLAQQRYRPAKDALAAAEADLEKAENNIKAKAAALEDRRKNFEQMAKAEMVKPFDCCKKKTENDCRPEQQTGQQATAPGRAL